jgi:hypothetical protein
MAVFDFDADENTDSEVQTDQQETVKITGNGPPDCQSFRMSIPKEIADNQDVTVGDMARVSPTEAGFKVEILDL